MAISDITVTVRLNISLDGKPISEVLEAPATYVLDKGQGLTVNLALDGDKLANALLPHLVRQVRNRTSLRPRGVH